MSAPTVFFIDDSATMREVIKIAFRRENIDVVACHDADAAVAEMQQHKPDVVISDVIMPGKDGYEVCQMIKQNAATAGTPVILMSGVVNRSVAEKAFAVKADELIRKPFQPQDLITRVRHLLQTKGARPENGAGSVAAAPMAAPIPAAIPAGNGNAPTSPDTMAALSSIFSGGTLAARAAQPARTVASVPASQSAMQAAAAPAAVARTATVVAPAPATAVAANGKNGNGSADPAKFKVEVMRLENLVKKLQSELQAEREYARALEEHIKTLQEAE